MRLKDLTERELFGIGAIGVILVILICLFLLTSCAPVEPLHQIRPVDFNHWKPSDIQPCIVARDKDKWRMVDEVRNCSGWVPV